MPNAGGNVGAHVGVEFGVFKRTIGHVVVVPAAIWPLNVGEPRICASRFIVHSHDVECHRSFNMVPWVAVTVWKPWNHSVWKLQCSNGVSSCYKFVGGDDVNEFIVCLTRKYHDARPGFCEYTM